VDFSDAMIQLRRGAETLPERIDAFAKEIEDWPAEQILESAATAIPHMVVTSSFGADSVVLLHLVHKVARDVPVLFLETGFHFPETLAFRDDLTRSLGLRTVDVKPEPWVQRQAARHGTALPMADADECCRLRKTLPLRKAMYGVDAWATGIRRGVTTHRAATPVVQATRQDKRWMLKIAPIATWTAEDVESYIADNDLPRHPLVELGYRSIGCAPCTRAVTDGEDARSGRWAHVPEKTECGLQLDWDEATGGPKVTRAATQSSPSGTSPRS
jgi:phosphoadenosine phosphosulfate reductase